MFWLGTRFTLSARHLRSEVGEVRRSERVGPPPHLFASDVGEGVLHVELDSG